MEDLEHYSSLRKKFTQELQNSFERSGESRPQTASKQVSFDFSDQLNIRELRNLREKHALEFERLSSPSVQEDPQEKKKKKKKKHERRKKKTKTFEAFFKPAIDLEHLEEFERSVASNRSSVKEFKGKNTPKNLSSQHSLYSENSVYSKKSLVEEIEDAYKEAKQALENSFKVDSKALDDVSVRSNKSSARFSQGSAQGRPTERQNFGIIENPSDRPSKTKNPQTQEFKKESEYSKKFEAAEQFLEKASRHSGKSSKSSKHSEQAPKHPFPVENIPNSPQHPPDFTVPKNKPYVEPQTEKFTSHNSHSKIFSKLVEKPLESAIHHEQSIHSDIEEEKFKEESLKSSVDFTISDQTPFESQKFSQDLHAHSGFNSNFERLEKGAFDKLLSPIIQNLAHETSSVQESPNKIEGFGVVPMDSPKGLEQIKKSGFEDNLELEHSITDFDLRTSKSQPLGNFRYEDSVYDHSESLVMSGNNLKSFEDFEVNEISINEAPKPFLDARELLQEKALIMIKCLEKAEIFLTAENVFHSFAKIKAKSEYRKNKSEKNKLAEANFEFNLLRKVMMEWKTEGKNSKICNSRKFIQYIERWNFVKLYHAFEGLKFVCRAHKQWIFEVRNKLKEHQRAAIFRNWALYLRYRRVKQSMRLRKMKKVMKGWNRVLVIKAKQNRRACVHWYLRKVFRSFGVWNEFYLRRREKWVKRVRADKKYYERIYTKVFLCWKHWKALEQANFIPLRICTKTVIVKKNGNIQEKSLLDIKIIKN